MQSKVETKKKQKGVEEESRKDTLTDCKQETKRNEITRTRLYRKRKTLRVESSINSKTYCQKEDTLK